MSGELKDMTAPPYPESPAPAPLPDLAKRRRAARLVAWGLAAVAGFLYLIAFFLPRN